MRLSVVHISVPWIIVTCTSHVYLLVSHLLLFLVRQRVHFASVGHLVHLFPLCLNTNPHLLSVPSFAICRHISCRVMCVSMVLLKIPPVLQTFVQTIMRWWSKIVTACCAIQILGRESSVAWSVLHMALLCHVASVPNRLSFCLPLQRTWIWQVFVDACMSFWWGAVIRAWSVAYRVLLFIQSLEFRGRFNYWVRVAF